MKQKAKRKFVFLLALMLVFQTLLIPAQSVQADSLSQSSDLSQSQSQSPDQSPSQSQSPTLSQSPGDVSREEALELWQNSSEEEQQAILNKFLLEHKEEDSLALDTSALPELSGDADSDKVRVVIVLESEPVISTAERQGLAVSDMSNYRVNTLSDGLVSEQERVKADLTKQGVEFSSTKDGDYLPANDNLTISVNAFTTYIDYKDIETVRSHAAVKEVYISNEYELPDYTIDLAKSGPMVNSPEAHNLGFKGEGQIVAVIDSGIDVSHPDLQKLSEGTTPALTESGVASIISGQGLSGRYLNPKVPYAYNYYDLSGNVLGVQSQHGQHVSGIVAANGSITGVAPEAQILGMKVFSDDIRYATTFSDIYIRAIDDAIILGTDVINMSLGSPAGFYVEDSIEDLALKNARNAGIVSAISAGNDYNIMYGATKFSQYLSSANLNPYAKNPDLGVVGSPSLNEASFSVASVDKTNLLMSSFSSWGTTPNLAIKPEISAPGGKIYSTYDAGKYATLSGTSMAAPHVAGGAALVQQYLAADSAFAALDLTPSERSLLAKNIIMNTASMLKDSAGRPYLVRRQGAGMMNLKNAVTTKQYLVEQSSKNAKIEAGDIDDTNFSFTLDLHNQADEDKTYAINGTFLTDALGTASGYIYSLGYAKQLENITLQGPEDLTVTVPANGKVSIALTVDFSAAVNQAEGGFGWNSFLEGFIHLTPAEGSEDTVPLQIPFLAFYGNWDEPSIIDEYRQNIADPTPSTHPLFSLTSPVLGYYSGTSFYYNYVDPDEPVYLNPGAIDPANGDYNYLGLMATVLRNAERVNFRVLDEDFNLLRTVDSYFNVKKISKMSQGTTPRTVFWNGFFDGMVDGKPLQDEQVVYYEAEFLRTLTSSPQVHRFKVIGDSTGPEVKDISTELQGGKTMLNFETEDSISGVNSIMLVSIWSLINPDLGYPILRPVVVSGQTSYSVDITSLLDIDGGPETSTGEIYPEVLLLVNDKAQNSTRANIYAGALNADQIANINVEQPIVDSVHAGDTIITGTSKKDHWIYVYRDDLTQPTMAYARTDENGAFALNIPNDQTFVEGDKLAVFAENYQGVRSDQVDVTVLEGDAQVDVTAAITVDSAAPPEGFDLSQTVLTAVGINHNVNIAAKRQENGTYLFKNLPLGNYYIAVTCAPSGFELDSYSRDLTVTEGMPAVTLNFQTIPDPPEREDDPYNQAQIFISSPDLLKVYTNSGVSFKGKTWGLNDINSLNAHSEDNSLNLNLPLTEKTKTSVVGDSGSELFFGTIYEFDTTYQLTDAYYKLSFTVSNGDPEADFSVGRFFFVDTTPPTIAAQPEERSIDEPQAGINFTLSDNFFELYLYRNDSFIEAFEISDHGLSSKDIKITYTDVLNLKPGTNTFTYRLRDLGGNESTETFTFEYISQEKELLKALIDIAEGMVPQDEDLTLALSAALLVFSDNNATEAEINAAADALATAISAQNPVALNPIILGAEDLRIPTGTVLDLLEGVTAIDVFGNNLSDRITADPETIDTSIVGTSEVSYSVTDNYNRTATKTITIEIYKPEVLKGLLEGALAEAKAINLSLYTSSTAAILQAAIIAADAVLADDEATQEQVNSAAAALMAAINALILKPAVGPTPPGPPAEDEPVSPSFSDIAPDDWFFEYIESLYALGIVSGYGESGEFRPNNNLNRQEAAKMIAIAAGKKAGKGFVSKFTDVKVNSWAFEFIAALEKHGVVSGYKGTAEFRPLKNIKRSHVSKMVVIAFGLDYGDVKKTFTDIQGADCEEFIKILASNGIVDGYKGTSIFKPNDEISRAEFAKIIDLAMKVGG